MMSYFKLLSRLNCINYPDYLPKIGSIIHPKKKRRLSWIAYVQPESMNAADLIIYATLVVPGKRENTLSGGMQVDVYVGGLTRLIQDRVSYDL